jgi:hypothetical protein
MTYEELKAAVLNLGQSEQKQLILEVFAKIIPNICNDESCLNSIRNFVDEATIKSYRDQHMDGI